MDEGKKMRCVLAIRPGARRLGGIILWGGFSAFLSLHLSLSLSLSRHPTPSFFSSMPLPLVDRSLSSEQCCLNGIQQMLIKCSLMSFDPLAIPPIVTKGLSLVHERDEQKS